MTEHSACKRVSTTAPGTTIRRVPSPTRQRQDFHPALRPCTPPSRFHQDSQCVGADRQTLERTGMGNHGASEPWDKYPAERGLTTGRRPWGSTNAILYSGGPTRTTQAASDA